MIVLSVGHCTYDLTVDIENLPEENTKNHLNIINKCGGGSASNGACLLGKYGIETYMSSIVGDDSYGNQIRKELQSFNINTDYLETSYGNNTDLSIILKNKKNGSRTIIGINQERLIKQKNDYAIMPDYLLIDTYDYNASLSALNQFPNAISILDADIADDVTIEMSKRATYVIASKKFAEKVSGIKMDFANPQSLVNAYSVIISKFPKKIFIITLEENGALYMIDNQIKVMPALKVDTQDTTGAGDFFRAAFLYAISQKYDFEKSVAFAVAASGLSVKSLGGRTSIPEVNSVLEEINKIYGASNDNNQQNPQT